MTDSNCPTALEFQQMLQGDVSDRRLEELSSHLVQCPDCSQLIEQIPDDGELRRAVRQSIPFNDDVIVRQAIDNARSIIHRRGTDALFDTARNSLDETLGSSESLQSFNFLAPPELPDEIGRLGKYRILQVLGQGGMGVVFRANDPELGRDVALKVLWTARPVSQSLRQRFAREAKALASVEHDNVVPVYSVDSGDETPFLTMKLLEGQTLADCLGDGSPMDQASVVTVGRQLAGALKAAHAAGVIHRDIKPGNIWIEESGKAKLIDFGLARTDDLDLTATGDIAGTPKYMSPEQANGQTATEQSDLFSLGSVLYYCLTGSPPFDGDSIPVVMRAIADGNYEDIAAICPAVNSELAEVIRRLLHVDPDQRLKTAHELEQRLSAIENRLGAPVQERELPSDTRPQSKSVRESVRKPVLIALLALAFLFLVAAAVVVTIRFDSGDTVVLTIDGTDEPVQLDVSESSFSFPDPTDGQRVQVSVDKERNQLRFEKDGFVAVGSEYDLSTPGGKRIRIRFQPVKDVPVDTPPLSQREIAEWVLSAGGSVVVTENFQEFETIDKLANLPNTPFRLFQADLSGCRNFMVDDLAILAQCDTLEGLRLLDTNVGDSAMTQLTRFPKLRSLDVSQTNVTNQALEQVRQLPLTVLHFTGTQIGDEGLKHLADHPTLTHAFLQYTQVTNDGIQHLASIPNVQVLYLSHNSLNDDALRHLSAATQLQELFLEQTNVTDLGLRYLEPLRRLKKLTLIDTGVSRKGIERLEAVLPECEIIWEGAKSK